MGLLVPTHAHAQEKESEDCRKTLFSDEYKCESALVRSFCATSGLPDESPELVVNPSSKFKFYQNSFCDLRRQDEDDLYDVVVDQMNNLQPNLKTPWDIAGVKSLLGKGFEDMVGNELEVYALVRSAYENEKVMQKTKKALKGQFKAKEMWANGSLLDSPFDLVVDLNLVEIALFGTQAQWMSDVYKYPKKQSAASDKASDAPPSPTGSDGNPPPSTNPPGAEEPPAKEDEKGSSDKDMCVPISGNDGKPDLPGDKPVVVTPPGTVPKDCGNRKVDPGEECDDGNTRAGDGCSSACLNEPGNTLACMDIQAVTLKPYVPKPAQKPVAATQGAATDPFSLNTVVVAPLVSEPELMCPEGTEPPQPKPPVQSLKYQGPNVGGVLREFPASNKPDCPNGTTSAEITIAGERHFRCVPTSACGDFEAVRELLFGKDYKNDPEKSLVAASIEAFVCIKVTQENRPESPYPLNESCIDCNIMAMNDILSKMLEKNVAPLENNSSAWGLSTRWGPGFTINLNVVSKMSVNALQRKLSGDMPTMSKAEEAYLMGVQACQDSNRKLNPDKADVVNPSAASKEGGDILGQQSQLYKKAMEDCLQKLKDYNTVSTAMNMDQRSYDPLSTMLNQMLGSFTRLQELNLQIATGIKFLEKKQCTK